MERFVLGSLVHGPSAMFSLASVPNQRDILCQARAIDALMCPDAMSLARTPDYCDFSFDISRLGGVTG